MVEHTISTKKALSEVIFIDNIIEGCWQNSIVDSDEPFESEYNKVIKDIVKIRPLMDGNEPICDGSIRNYECNHAK